MRTEYQSQAQMPYRNDVPFETRQAAIEERIAAEQASVKRAGEDAKNLALASQEYRDDLVKLLGHDKYAQLRAYVHEQKRYARKFLLPPRGPEMSKEEVDRFRGERREESLAFLNQLGIAPSKLQSLSQRVGTRIKQLGPSHPVRDGKRVMLQLPSDVPQEIRAGKTNPWTYFAPPYPGWAWSYTGFNAGFTFIPTLYLDPGIGLVGNINHLQDTDASDNDYGHMVYNTAIRIWYQMPTAGLIEAWIEGQVASAHHRVSLHDEFGWSDSDAWQHDYLTFNATVGGSSSAVQMSEMSWFSEEGNTDGYWDNEYLTEGASYWANLVSDRSVIIPAGAWVLLEVGMTNFNATFANDVTVYSTMDFRWIIKQVIVHSTGG